MPAIVDAEKCTGCGDCVDICPSEAIEIKDNLSVISADDCIDCGACVEACPTEAISMAD